MKNENCSYCMKNELLEKFGYLAWETENSLIIVFKDQTKPGRMIVAYKGHEAEIQYLSDDKRNAFLKDVSDIAKAIQKAYHPDRINYGAFGDTGGHLHFHLVPKYKDGAEWGGMFTMNTGVLVDEKECEKVAEKIKQAYQK
ncbi:Histidine triad protein [Alteracholeplasma palmae J233]|uniref:Histidine triad protein n=1 Tax=Alteracholeplasma palmae (strain ATCC 49389 / J233) TaxID=1318466 RepID=U4KR82_ALTPJ|nr:HIT family protein [Alteracholeplasma palmae]CCV63931.1 Histidine triad protein [Alteracholeplasma palmae J233]